MSWMPLLSLLLDFVLIGLLGFTIFYVFRLNRRIGVLQQSRMEIEKLVHDFGSIVNRAEAGVNGLRLAAEQSGYDLQKQIERASALREEMHFMIETADQLANKITDMATAGRPATPASPAPMSDVSAPPAGVSPPPVRSRAEQELLQALGKRK